LEGQGRQRSLDALDRVDPAVHEPADIDVSVDVELGQEDVLAAGRIDLRSQLAVRKRRRDVIGAAKLAAESSKETLQPSASGWGGSRAGAGGSGNGQPRRAADAQCAMARSRSTPASSSISSSRAWTTSPRLAVPASRPPATTGRWRTRFVV